MLDYYIKGLPARVRQIDLPSALRKINDVSVEYILEKPDGYTGLKKCGMDEDDIRQYLERETEYFKEVNQVMIQNGRPPLFPEPNDAYKSAVRYLELIYRYHEVNERIIPKFLNHGKESESEEKLIKIMGCTWEEYMPEKYEP